MSQLFLRGKDETFITAASEGPEPERGGGGVDRDPTGQFRC